MENVVDCNHIVRNHNPDHLVHLTNAPICQFPAVSSYIVDANLHSYAISLVFMHPRLDQRLQSVFAVRGSASTQCRLDSCVQSSAKFKNRIHRDQKALCFTFAHAHRLWTIVSLLRSEETGTSKDHTGIKEFRGRTNAVLHRLVAENDSVHCVSQKRLDGLDQIVRSSARVKAPWTYVYGL